ncbi:MAG TPA: Arm DNA-binding domain-containing protein [Stellaceae bacterium]|nr:Arm DNA-binding domain-containing protein [Stellaceae bacterium]
MASKITKRLVDTATPDAAKDAFWWDSELRGFGLKVTPAGVKVYVLQYHVGTGRKARRRRLVIGRHGSPWTPETARTEAKRFSGDVAKGLDPWDRRQQERNMITVAELCDLYSPKAFPIKRRRRCDQIVPGSSTTSNRCSASAGSIRSRGPM